jgi:crossover junction endodeoxyribonuclease RuvC
VIVPRARTRPPVIVDPPRRTRPLAGITPPPPLLPVLPVSIAFFDLSLTGTGVALYKDGEITTQLWKSKLKGMARLADLDDRIRTFLMEEYPAAVGVEGYSFGSKNSRAHSIGEWGGVAKMAIMERTRIKAFIASPGTVKKFMTGAGNAAKSEMPLHLFKRYGITVPQEDEADATCGSILIGAHLYASAFTSLTQFQRDAIKGIELMA